MIKKFLLFSFAVILNLSVIGQNLYKIELNPSNNLKNYIDQTDFKIHYFNDAFLIGSGMLNEIFDATVLEENIRQKDQSYFLVWLPEDQRETYILKVKQSAEIIYKDNAYLICKSDLNKTGHLIPGVHGGIVHLDQNTKYKIPQKKDFKIKKNPDPVIESYVAEVIADSIMEDIQHMEDYGTRYYNTSQASQAQDWIQTQFENYGLTTELTPTGASGSSMNVIAYQTGLVYPDTYIIVGGHYDSISYGSTSPGSDDNASGTAGVMEIARILSNYDFMYSIIYCAWSAEEIGLYGSGAWAGTAASNGMDIIGYLNLDMIGYLHSGDDYHTDMIAPSSAQPLVDFYYNIVDLYVNDFEVFEGNLIGGDSDHTSFNNNGYMGIFPFEDDDNHSPYIHSENDLIGPSVNSSQLVKRFVQAGVAFIASAAEPFNGLYPPMNLTLTQTDETVQLDWEAPLNQSKELNEYKVYRNSELLTTITDPGVNTYTDETVILGEAYEYYITAVYTGSPSGESYPSNKESLIVGLFQIYFYDFEDGPQDWTLLNTSLGWQWGVSVNLSGNNTEYLSIDSDAAGSGNHVYDYAVSPELDMSGYSVAYLEFDFGYRDYYNDFFKLLYRTSPGSDWVELSNMTESTSFTHFSTEIPEAALTENMQLAFYYDDNDDWAWYAAVDNVEINAVNNSSVDISNTDNKEEFIKIHPNPANENIFINYCLTENTNVSVSLFDISGKRIKLIENGYKLKGDQNLQISAENLKSGYYILKIETNYCIFTKNIIKI